MTIDRSVYWHVAESMRRRANKPKAFFWPKPISNYTTGAGGHCGVCGQKLSGMALRLEMAAVTPDGEISTQSMLIHPDPECRRAFGRIVAYANRPLAEIWRPGGDLTQEPPPLDAVDAEITKAIVMWEASVTANLGPPVHGGTESNQGSVIRAFNGVIEDMRRWYSDPQNTSAGALVTSWMFAGHGKDCERCSGMGVHDGRDCDRCGGTGKIVMVPFWLPDWRGGRVAAATYDEYLDPRAIGAKPGPSHGWWVFKIVEAAVGGTGTRGLNVVVEVDQLRAVLLGLQRGLVLRGVRLLGQCETEVGEYEIEDKGCRFCGAPPGEGAKHRPVPVLLPIRGSKTEAQILDEFRSFTHGFPVCASRPRRTDDEDYDVKLVKWTESMAANLNQGPAVGQLWHAAQWLAGQYQGDDRLTAHTISLLKGMLAARWLGPRDGFSGGDDLGSTREIEDEDARHQAIYAMLADRNQLEAPQLLHWIRARQERGGGLIIDDKPDATLGYLQVDEERKVVVMALPDGTRRGGGALQPHEAESDPEVYRTAVKAMAEGMRAVDRMIDADRLAIKRREDGETMESARGEFSVGDYVIVRREVWERVKGSDPGDDDWAERRMLVTPDARNRRGSIATIDAPNTIPRTCTVRHTTGRVCLWPVTDLKLLSCARLDELPESRVDLNSTLDDFHQRMTLRRQRTPPPLALSKHRVRAEDEIVPVYVDDAGPKKGSWWDDEE